MMTSPIHGESESYESPYREGSKRHSSLFHTGVLLLEDAERAPEYLRLTIDSDPDEPDQVDQNESDSEEDVILLGEKRPTYQEITLDEDDEGEVKEKVIEKEKEEPHVKMAEDPLYECPYCDKSFRVESLLKFHIKMHNSSVSSNEAESSSSMITNYVHDSEKITEDKRKKKRHSMDAEPENELKTNRKSSHKHKVHREKRKSHKHKKHKRSVSM